MNSNSEKVELHPAFMWDCHECGRENFLRTPLRQPTQEDLEDMNLLDDDNDWELVYLPESVVCKFCKKEFDIDVDDWELSD